MFDPTAGKDIGEFDLHHVRAEEKARDPEYKDIQQIILEHLRALVHSGCQYHKKLRRTRQDKHMPWQISKYHHKNDRTGDIGNAGHVIIYDTAHQDSSQKYDSRIDIDQRQTVLRARIRNPQSHIGHYPQSTAYKHTADKPAADTRCQKIENPCQKKEDHTDHSKLSQCPEVGFSGHALRFFVYFFIYRAV